MIRSRISHQPTKYYFIFGEHSVHYSPGRQQKTVFESGFHSWAAKESALREWLAELRQEVDAPDLWASIGPERELANAALADEVENTLFNENELRLIGNVLDDLRKEIGSMEQSEMRQAAIIDNQFAYMRQASTRMGRKDWLMLFYGDLVNILTNFLISPEQVHQILGGAATALQSFWTKLIS